MAVPPGGLNRIRRELAELNKNGMPIVHELTLNDNNERDWTVVLAPDREPYKGAKLKIHVVFGARYPFQPPILTFQSKMYHPNIDGNTGKMCFSVINPETWRAGVSIRDVFNALNRVLVEPELDRPSNADASQKYQNDRNEYDRLVKQTITNNEQAEQTNPVQQQQQPQQPQPAPCTEGSNPAQQPEPTPATKETDSS